MRQLRPWIMPTVAMVALVLAATLSGCAKSSPLGCEDTCVAENSTQCLGTMIQMCSREQDGCLRWLGITDCAVNGQQCQVTNGLAGCGLCADQCAPTGASRCQGEVIETCAQGAGGCLDWIAGTDCSQSGQTCDNSGGSATCVGSCSDQCTPSGSTRCQGDIIETCATAGNGCLAWVAGTDCSQGGQVCDASGGTATCVGSCSDLCTPSGTSRCQGNVIETCATAGNGCPDWVAGTDCSQGGQICDASGGTALCAYAEPGHTCSDPVDVTSASFPVTLTGTFTEDPAAGGSCDTTPTNAVWFSYTPASTGHYQLDLVNQTTTSAYGRVAVFEGDSCAPLGTQVACVSPSSKNVSTIVYLTAGTPYLILFHTDGNGYSMVNPQITITPFTYPEGAVCSSPIDVTGQVMPVVTSGTFTEDPATGGSCDTTPTNAVWFSYTASTSELHEIVVTNHTSSGAFSRLAIFEGTSCNPLGTQVSCVTSSTTTITRMESLVAGTTYLLLFYTDGDSYSMVNPEIDIGPFAWDPGEDCSAAVDVTGASFPVTLTGTFAEDPAAGSTCDTTPTNAVWFSFTPATTGHYQLDLVNQSTSSAYGRVAVFEGDACSPLGAQVACVAPSSKNVSTIVYLTAGTPHLILFHTDGDGYTMVNPRITITPYTYAEGAVCNSPIDVTGLTMPVVTSGTFTEDPVTGGSCDTTPTNAVWFSYTASTSEPHEIVVTNHTGSAAFSRLAIFEGTSCNPYGTQVSCVTASTTTITRMEDLVAGTTYLLLFYTDGDGYSMVNPEIDIGPFAWDPGEVCSAAMDVSAASFPVTLTGTFGEDPATGSTCDTSPTNAVWFSYTPATTGHYQLDLVNQSTSSAYGRVAVFAGDTCSPLGTQLACVAPSTKNVSTIVYLTAGTPHRILFHTDGDTYTMVNPRITISPVTVPAGSRCTAAADVTGQTFPYTLTGTFGEDPTAGGTCDTSPTNAVFWTYTPPTTGSVTVTVTNHTTTSAFSRLAIFQTAACTPYGTQVACVTASAKTVSTTVSLTGGVPYLLLYYTDGDNYTTVNPDIDIQ